MTENDWRDLIDSVRRGEVIPIVGPELLVVPSEGETRISLETQIARQLATALDLPVDDLPAGLCIRDVANAYIQVNGYRNRQRLKGKLGDVLQALTDRPPAFDLLAEITGFKLFVSITPDA